MDHCSVPKQKKAFKNKPAHCLTKLYQILPIVNLGSDYIGGYHYNSIITHRLPHVANTSALIH